MSHALTGLRSIFGGGRNRKRALGAFEQEEQVDLSSLLQRAPRKIDQRAARKLLGGKRVLVTGAGGTIGSELARQVAAFDPALLALVDNAEFNLYQIDLELREAGFGEILYTALTDVCRRKHLDRVFEIVEPEIVIHAAAF